LGTIFFRENAIWATRPEDQTPFFFTYEISKEFKAAPEIVFRSFIDEETLKKIRGVSAIKIDARPEGKARAKLQIGNENWDFTITYKEVVPNEKLRWIAHFDRFPSKETRTTLLLTKVPEGTRLIFRQENFQTSQERDENRQAIAEALKTLDGLLTDGKADH
jgi:uncharacterized protein YndB with AHSA1/START domain